MSIVTISGGVKSGREKLAALLAEKLAYDFYYREIISECSRKYNIMESELLEELEEWPSLWRRLSGERKRQLIYIKCAILNAAKKDNMIYYGPFGQLFLAGINNVLKIRLEAPFEERVNAVIKEKNIDHEEAVDYVNDLDKNRSRMIKMLYDEYKYSTEKFDLVVNLNNISLDTVAGLAMTALNSRELQTNDNTIKALNKTSLECEVKAAIASDEKIWDQPITILIFGDSVIIRGFVKNKKIRDRIVGTVSQVKGVNKCEFYIGLLSDPIHMELYSNV